jgi:hypothetical protein
MPGPFVLARSDSAAAGGPAMLPAPTHPILIAGRLIGSLGARG